MKKAIYYIFALCLAACSVAPKQAEDEQEEADAQENIVELTDQQISTVGIKIGEIERRQLSGTINATGTLKLSPQNRAEVSSLVSGVAKSILVKEGQAVRQGQIVAMVENTEIVALQKDYLVATRQLALAKQTLQRQQEIRDQGAGVEKNLQQAQAEYDMAAATEQGLRIQLEQIGISSSQVAEGKFSNSAPVCSPIAGIVGEILISTGSYLSSETILMKIYDNKSLHADVNVFETDISRIHVEQEVSMQLSDSESLTGKVSFITATLDDKSKSALVHIDILSAEGKTLLPNMFVSAAIHCDNQTCDAVPDEAIVMSANRKYVFVSLDSNTFRKQEVVTGISQQGYTQITFTDEVPQSTKIVTAKAFYLESILADHGEEE